jgi:hypothetical protein
MRRLLIVVMAVALLAATPSVAHAYYLSKSEARAEAKHFVREHVKKRAWSWATYWSVERAYKCSRATPSIVECDFQMVDEEDVDEDGSYYGCDDTVRVRATRRWFYATYPYDADCGYNWTD